MDPPLSSWKYESGFLTIFHAGKSYELGYFKLHEDARNAALAFRKARRMSQPKRVVRGLRGSRTPHPSKEVHMLAEGECQTTFAVSGGIFGVGSLATRLNELVASHQIGEWHIGHWKDWRRTAIRINFATVADTALAKAACAEA